MLKVLLQFTTHMRQVLRSQHLYGDSSAENMIFSAQSEVKIPEVWRITDKVACHLKGKYPFKAVLFFL